MNTHSNPTEIEKVKGKYIIADTNVLSAWSSSTDYYQAFFNIFQNNSIWIDPIVKLEFLRGAYQEKTYKEKTNFLKIEKFSTLVDHQDIYKKVYITAFNIARIYSHHGKPNVPLGDILITARLEVGKDFLFLTEDIEDFPTLLFDRLCIITFERKRNKDNSEYLEHLQLIQFNQEKYKKCLVNLPQ